MSMMLLLGAAFWSTIAFVGVRKTFGQGENAFTVKMRAIDSWLPGSLWTAGIVGLLGGTGLEIVEVVRIGRVAGWVGGFAALGFVCVVVGASCLSAHLALDGEKTRRRT